MATIQELRALALQIRDADEPAENTALKVGQFLYDLLGYLDTKADLAMKGQWSKQLSFNQTPIVALQSVEAIPDSQGQNNKMWWSSDDGQLKWKANDEVYPLGSPTYVLYYCGKKIYRWEGSSVGFTLITGAPVNNLTDGGVDAALSAKQGKVLKANIEIVQANIETLKNAVANIAFTSLPKPTLTGLDFGGDKFAVTVNNSLTGCTADKSGIQQVGEGSNLIVTITAGAGNLIRSVSASAGTVAIAENKETATVTLANVLEDTTLAITASATAKGSFTASISDARVDGTGASSDIAEGSSWSSVLSLNGTAEEGAVITSISASMNGGGTISVEGDTVSTAFVTGDITITVHVQVVGKVTIQYNTDKWRKIPATAQVNEGQEATIVIEPMESFLLAEVKYTVDGGTEQTGTIVDNACTLVVTANSSLVINTKTVMDVVLGETISYDGSILSTRLAASPAGQGSLYVKSYVPVPAISNGDTILYYHQFSTTSPKAGSGVATYSTVGGSATQGRGCGDAVYLSSTFQSKNSGHKYLRMAFRYSNSNTSYETSFGERSFALNGTTYITETDIVDAINFNLANSNS